MIDAGRKMLELRERSELNQLDFCSKFGLNLEELNSWETGESTPMYCIPFMIEMLLNYEDRFGEIEFSHVPMSASKRLKGLRYSLELSRDEFSKKFLVGTASCRSWEAGRTVPPSCVIPMMYKIVRYEELFGIKLEAPDWVNNIRAMM